MAQRARRRLQRYLALHPARALATPVLMDIALPGEPEGIGNLLPTTGEPAARR